MESFYSGQNGSLLNRRSHSEAKIQDPGRAQSFKPQVEADLGGEKNTGGKIRKSQGQTEDGGGEEGVEP